jgi:hypothetical protein
VEVRSLDVYNLIQEHSGCSREEVAA